MKKTFADTAITKWQRYSWQEKATIIYVLWILMLFLLTPLVKIDQINTTQSEFFTLFDGAMVKTYVIMLISVLFLIVQNSSYSWKKRLHKTFGYSESPWITNAVVFFLILVILFTMGDTVWLLNENFSTRIGTTSWFLIIGIYLIAWIAWQLAFTRIRRKQQIKSDGITIKESKDDTKKKRDFQQMEKEFQWLFDENSDNKEQ